MNLIGKGFRALGETRRAPSSVGRLNFVSFALRRKSSASKFAVFSYTSTGSATGPPHFSLVRWWSLDQLTVNKRFVSSSRSRSLPGRSMGSGGSKSKDKDKKGTAAASAEGAKEKEQQVEEGDKTIGEVTSDEKQQQKSEETQQQVEQEASREEKMSEEYVEAVVAKASEFGDNE